MGIPLPRQSKTKQIFSLTSKFPLVEQNNALWTHRDFELVSTNIGISCKHFWYLSYEIYKITAWKHCRFRACNTFHRNENFSFWHAFVLLQSRYERTRSISKSNSYLGFAPGSRPGRGCWHFNPIKWLIVPTYRANLTCKGPSPWQEEFFRQTEWFQTNCKC